jgi:hypothetical protein
LIFTVKAKSLLFLSLIKARFNWFFDLFEPRFIQNPAGWLARDNRHHFWIDNFSRFLAFISISRNYFNNLLFIFRIDGGNWSSRFRNVNKIFGTNLIFINFKIEFSFFPLSSNFLLNTRADLCLFFNFRISFFDSTGYDIKKMSRPRI